MRAVAVGDPQIALHVDRRHDAARRQLVEVDAVRVRGLLVHAEAVDLVEDEPAGAPAGDVTRMSSPWFIGPRS